MVKQFFLRKMGKHIVTRLTIYTGALVVIGDVDQCTVFDKSINQLKVNWVKDFVKGKTIDRNW